MTTTLTFTEALSTVVQFWRQGVSPGQILAGFLQLEIGGMATRGQLVTSANDVTEPGVPDVWHLFNDGGDSLPVTLPTGTYGRAFVDHLGAVTVDTVVNPVNALMTTRQADMILRQGAFSAAEIASITAYWEARYK
ncbi:hypothetical protein [Pseudogemmobacter faecipullorum]|uniref:Uncharacterized protein n=1 Tax=Pseudogemmobacter faecipullorum TaxID=2755041 RepID=A0ABS8CQV8_9RHOB|nr:hypothetical protein [Pseudogemmobacter faecipullorum]MCB5411769.1 hypothetical protein [Pseudogemmobacter faecipullorum]